MWISVKDRWPEHDEEVLMYNTMGSMRSGYTTDCGDYIRLKFGGVSKEINSWDIKVTHWMPLPEPPND